MHSILVLVISANHTEVRVLQSILSEQSEGEVAIVGSADRGEEALSRSLALRPQVILVNLDRVEDGALEIVSRLRGLVLDAGIVALIPPAGAVYEELARVAGADAVVARADVATGLMPAVRRAARSEQSRRRLAEQGAPEQAS
jgi:DNA-binding NarL/FixJ family response regulator